MSSTINASTSSGIVQTADTSGILQLQSNGTTMQTVDSTGSYGQLKQATAVPYTSFTTTTYNDFLNIPSWVKRITVIYSGISTSGTSNYLLQIGSGSVTATGYAGQNWWSTGSAANSTGFIIIGNTIAANTYYGTAVLTNLTGNTWVLSGVAGPNTSANNPCMFMGGLALSGALDRVRITTTNGTDTFDAGTVNILYEG